VLIPLSVERPVRRRPVVVPALIAINILCFALDGAAAALIPELHARLYPMLWVVGGEGFRPWQLLTHAFLHAGAIHLIGNMLILWVFGPSVEDRFGHLGFLALFAAGAILAGGLHAAFERVSLQSMLVESERLLDGFAAEVGLSSDEASAPLAEAAQAAGPFAYIPAVGASGAIAAVTGSFLVLFPRTWVRSLFLIGLAVGRVPAWWFIGLAIAWDLLSQSFGVDRNVAHLAHLGGYLTGFSVSMLLLWRRVFPREPYDLFTVFHQAKRRRDIRAAAAHATPRPVRAAAPRARRGEPAPDPARADALAHARAEVSRMAAESRIADAANAYALLLDRFAPRPAAPSASPPPTPPQIDRALTLSRDTQLAIARALYESDRRTHAAAAFDQFLASYPPDREGDAVRVLLARLLLASSPPATARATDLLRRVESSASDETLRALARDEIARLPIAPSRPA
jgi:membrane associated rhomboid family serine protease